MAFEYEYERTTPYNPAKLDTELRAVSPSVDGFAGRPGIITVVALAELTTPEQAAAQAAVVNHDPANTPAQAEQLSGRAALAAVLNNRADDLKYADYFFSRSIALSAQWMPPRDTNLTTLTTATVTLMQGDRATDVNHNAMWRIFLWKLRMKYNIFNTEDELPNPLNATQARQVLIEADSFIKWGVDASHILLLRDLI